jgi:serine phosphatase RsbU (regulator of sigma subunit)
MRETRSPRGPLGITGEVIYSETSLHLRPADTLTCVSDGVAEARNGEGTLFGFDRTQSIISQPAHSIADAAQSFGQEDDITVLTLAFVPVHVHPA